MVEKYGSKKTIIASREVILSAGAVQTPQLLMLSGIGPRAILEETGIETIVDSPGVGENLQDHVAMGGAAYLFDPPGDPEDHFGFILPKVLPFAPIG